MYLTSMWQPGQDRSIYLYAHARTGMFLPILNASLVANGKKMLGMIVEVWTDDNQRYLYEITDVRRHQHTLESAFQATSETLWLQTSEGPEGDSRQDAGPREAARPRRRRPGRRAPEAAPGGVRPVDRSARSSRSGAGSPRRRRRAR